MQTKQFCLIAALTGLSCTWLAAQETPTAARSPDVKMITSFEKDSPLTYSELIREFPAAEKIIPPAKTEIVSEHATDGASSLKMYSEAGGPAVAVLKGPLDWSGYDYLKVDVYNSAPAAQEFNVVIVDPNTRDYYWKQGFIYKVAPPGVTGWDDSGDNRAFQAEQVVFATNSGTVYMWAQANKPDLAKRMAIALTPEGPAGRHNIASMRSLTIFKNSANVPAAKKLLAYLTKPDNYQKWLEGYGGYYAPAYSGTMKQPYWQDPIRKVFMENAKYGHGIGWPGPLTVAAREAYANFFVTEMVQMVVVQGKTAEAAVKETAQRLKEIYSRY